MRASHTPGFVLQESMSSSIRQRKYCAHCRSSVPVLTYESVVSSSPIRNNVSIRFPLRVHSTSCRICYSSLTLTNSNNLESGLEDRDPEFCESE